MSFHQLFRRLHRDQRGAVSLETLLIIGAIALPVLIFLIKFGWPKVRYFFTKNMNTLEEESEHVIGGGSR